MKQRNGKTEYLIRRIAEQGEPVVRAEINARQLVGTIASPWTSFEGMQIEPEGKQVEEQLAAGLVGTFAATFEEGPQHTVDGFGGTTGTDNAFEQGQQILSQLVGDGIVDNELAQQLTRLGGGLGE